MKINVYIDGFNLYYGALRKTPYKWLDLSRLCTLLFPSHTISKIKYFTAKVKVRPHDNDPDKPNRQQIYLRALKTLDTIEIIYGSFLSHTVTMKRADTNGYVRVQKTEEKGTDVNIATHLVNDAHNGDFEMAVVITNDSDLVEPIRIVTKELNLPVVIVSPYERNSIELKKCATSVKHLREGILFTSQFPNTLTDAVGNFSRPESWYSKTTVELKAIFEQHKDKRITVIGTSCTGKTALMKDFPESVAISKIAPALSDEEKAFTYKTPWTREIGEKMIELRGNRAYIEPGKTAFGTTIAANTELIVYLDIDDSLLRKRTQSRNVSFTDAKAMKVWIEEKIKESRLPVITVKVK